MRIRRKLSAATRLSGGGPARAAGARAQVTEVTAAAWTLLVRVEATGTPAACDAGPDWLLPRMSVAVLVIIGAMFGIDRDVPYTGAENRGREVLSRAGTCGPTAEMTPSRPPTARPSRRAPTGPRARTPPAHSTAPRSTTGTPAASAAHLSALHQNSAASRANALDRHRRRGCLRHRSPRHNASRLERPVAAGRTRPALPPAVTRLRRRAAAVLARCRQDRPDRALLDRHYDRAYERRRVRQTPRPEASALSGQAAPDVA